MMKQRRKFQVAIIVVLILFLIVLIVTAVWDALDDVPSFYVPSTTVSMQSVFASLNASDESENVRAKSWDAFVGRFVGKWTSDPNVDISWGRIPEVVLRVDVRLVTLNPVPIYMYQSRNTQAMLAYQANSDVETSERRIVRAVLAQARGGFAMDIGANDGFYTLLFAAYGLRVVSFEPQPNCAAMLYASIAFNDFPYPPKLLNKLASVTPLTARIDRRAACRGTQTFASTTESTTAADETVDVIGSVSPADVLMSNGGRAAMVHIDVEGAEIRVLESMEAYFLQGTIYNVVFEYVPKRWINETSWRDKLGRWFFGYACVDLRSLRLIDVALETNVEYTDVFCRLKGLPTFHVDDEPKRNSLGKRDFFRPGH